MTYRRRASPLHAARAAAALSWCLALALTALVQSNPVVLGCLALSVLVAGQLAQVGPELRRALRLALPLAITICVINALITRDGLTIIWRFGDLPILGQTNVTLEATVYGAVLGLRAAVLVLIGALYSVAIDPDEVLKLFRRVSFHSALSATIATRMVPLLIRDGRRLADAQRCRSGAAPGRVALMRATTSGVLDRALDVAAALEVRGYTNVRQAPRRGRLRRPWSRHDLAFCGSAMALTVLAVGSRLASWVPFAAYPALRCPVDVSVLAVTVGLVCLAVLPLLSRRGVAR